MLFRIIQTEKDEKMAHTIEVLATYAEYYRGIKESYVSSRAICRCHFHDGSVKGAIVWMPQIEEFITTKGYMIEGTTAEGAGET